jgi:P-type Cu+ transporter
LTGPARRARALGPFTPRRHTKSPTALSLTPIQTLSFASLPLPSVSPPADRPCATADPLSKLDAAAGEGAAGATTALLDVSGMMCGGCATRVRSILATHPLVEMAAVNLLAESAAVRLWAPTPPGTGEELAARLTECGFPATARRG